MAKSLLTSVTPRPGDARSPAPSAPPPAVVLDHVAKYYKRHTFTRQFLTLKTALLKGDLFKILKPQEVLVALEDISLEIPRGIAIGIIGPNGAGKSTLLKLIAGITKPSRGHVQVNGRVSALIELGAGFHPELTGRENIYINGIMLGLSKAEVRRRMDDIIRFAELEEFIDSPVRTYSSGMFMRLGFSVAVHVDPDILLVDEVLAVGDEAFAHKCLERMLAFKSAGKTIILVTHALGLVEEFCDVAVWLKRGRIQKIGDPREIVGLYRLDVACAESQRIARDDAAAQQAATQTPESAQPGAAVLDQVAADVLGTGAMKPRRWGDRTVTLDAVRVCNAAGAEARVFRAGEPLLLQCRITVQRPVTDFVFGVGIFNAEGVRVFGTNTHLERFVPERLDPGVHTFEVRFDRIDLLEGLYYLDVAVHRRDGYPYDYHHAMYSFRVYREIAEVGIVHIPHRWVFGPGIRLRRPEEDPA